MKKQILLLLVCSLYLFANAKENTGKSKSKDTPQQLAVNCVPGTAQVDLDFNNVRARVMQSGDMWWDLISAAQYEVPNGSGKMSMFAGSLWIGGVDAGGQVKVAAQTYRQTGNDFWPGPLDTTIADITQGQCLAFDQFWKITKSDVINFVNNGITTPEILNWPGNGNPAFNEAHFLAPFLDINGDGIYNTNDGDYPYYNLNNSIVNCNDVLHGDQTIWWVFNDAGNLHGETGSDIIGLEIQAQAFSFSSPVDAINNSTFYQYKIINRSSFVLNQTYFGQWADPDLGNALDDFVGCDVNRGLGFCYNADANDDLPSGYGLNPPAIGVDFLQGPLADLNDGIDNDRDGITDEPGEQIIMSKFIYYNNVNGTPTGNPNGFDDFYFYLRGMWLDGIPMTYGLDGYDPASTNYCNFMFPDNTDTSYYSTLGTWTEVTASNIPGDRRFLQSAGQFTLLPGAVNYITVGVIWARDTLAGASLDSLKTADDYVQQFYDSCFYLTTSVNQITANEIQPTVYPNPFSQQTIFNFSNPKAEEYSLTLFDSKGTIVKRINQVISDFIVLKKENLKSGVYLFSLKSSSKSYTGKIVIE